ncbi:hypothetical protein TNCV_2655651 [Trichonephila clavipes]|nr:hypothetical protein TNCV_2655651 [Trichonephila clavipes]
MKYLKYFAYKEKCQYLVACPLAFIMVSKRRGTDSTKPLVASEDIFALILHSTLVLNEFDSNFMFLYRCFECGPQSFKAIDVWDGGSVCITAVHSKKDTTL